MRTAHGGSRLRLWKEIQAQDFASVRWRPSAAASHSDLHAAQSDSPKLKCTGRAQTGAHEAALNQLAFSPLGNCLVTSSVDCTLRYWSPRRVELEQETGAFLEEDDVPVEYSCTRQLVTSTPSRSYGLESSADGKLLFTITPWVTHDFFHQST